MAARRYAEASLALHVERRRLLESRQSSLGDERRQHLFYFYVPRRRAFTLTSPIKLLDAASLLFIFLYLRLTHPLHVNLFSLQTLHNMMYWTRLHLSLAPFLLLGLLVPDFLAKSIPRDRDRCLDPLLYQRHPVALSASASASVYA